MLKLDVCCNDLIESVPLQLIDLNAWLQLWEETVPPPTATRVFVVYAAT